MTAKRVAIFSILLFVAVLATRPAWSHPEHGDDKNGKAKADSKAKAAPKKPADDPEWVQNIDAMFGKYLVNPLATVLFYGVDVSFLLGSTEQDIDGNPVDKADISLPTISANVDAILQELGEKKPTAHPELITALSAGDYEIHKDREKYPVTVKKANKADTWILTAMVKVDGEWKRRRIAVSKDGKQLNAALLGYVLTTKIPVVVLWLLAGGVFFTLRMGFINFRAFWHAIRLTRGDFDDPDNPGEVSHFQALSSALSATVGLGNIGGVAIAVGTGGPGAVFWMILAGFLGMSMKFAECTLGQLYRKVDKEDGAVSGGPMHYLKDGLGEMGLKPLGTVLAFIYALMCIAASFGGGCAFQVGQSGDVLEQQVPFLAENPWLYGLIMCVMVGVVIIGGIRRIAATAGAIVPLMCGIYVLVAMYVLLTNAGQIGPAFGKIFGQAFSENAMFGGGLGVLILGIKRAVFSNEAGAGSAAIAHAAAKTEHPVSEGIVALLEPFIDTVVVCTMTGLVIVISGVYADPAHEVLVASDKGAALTSEALALSASWFPFVLAVAVVMFAYSTMISWSYYGERCWSLIFGANTAMIYRVLFLVFVFLGAIVGAKNINDFSSLLILGLSFPNLLGVVLLSGKVKKALNEYWALYKSGGLERHQSDD